jgi:hypothetical protein
MKLLTTHFSYDHLDWPTIKRILEVRGPQVQFLVPLGNKQWFVDAGIEELRIHEMDWWEKPCAFPTRAQGAYQNHIHLLSGAAR